MPAIIGTAPNGSPSVDLVSLGPASGRRRQTAVKSAEGVT